MVDAKEGVICIEWIDGKSVRRLLPGGDPGDEEEDELEEEEDELEKLGVSQGTPHTITFALCPN
jgi:TP53 regulating kinase-like protein